jgi:4-hydroxy-3-methylbut-2-enyl diphosphate reductase
VIVVGDPKSNNSNRLAQVSEEIAGTKAYRVGDVSEIDPAWLMNVQRVGVTSGASTPTPITKEVITYLEQFNPNDTSTWVVKRSVDLARLLPKSKEKSSS